MSNVSSTSSCMMWARGNSEGERGGARKQLKASREGRIRGGHWGTGTEVGDGRGRREEVPMRAMLTRRSQMVTENWVCMRSRSNTNSCIRSRSASSTLASGPPTRAPFSEVGVLGGASCSLSFLVSFERHPPEPGPAVVPSWPLALPSQMHSPEVEFPIARDRPPPAAAR